MTATLSEPGPAATAPRLIGGLAADPRGPAVGGGSVRVLVQGKALLTVPRAIAQAEGLAPGMPLSEPLYARLCRAADEEAAYRTALRFLERRPFAASDLTRRLVLKGHPPEAATAAVARAQAAGLVDDARFTLHYVETRAARGRGPLRLRRDLAALGVERSLVDRALSEAFGADGGQAPSVEAVARKRLAQLNGLPRTVLRRRLLAYLARRGFVGDAVQRLVGELLGRE